MQRKNFALIWGRKIFFGLSFPLSCFLGLLYLHGSPLPMNFTEWFYFISNLVGYFGLINVLVFYILFYPLSRISPSYYVVRLWSLLLIMLLNGLILMDALIFSTYQAHLYSDIGRLIFSEGLQHLVPNGVIAGILAGFLAYALMVWFRGETTWRSMQGRFYNPIGGIHLGVIFLSLFLGKVVYFFSSVHPQFASYFPYDLNYRSGTTEVSDRKEFSYLGDLKCQGKSNPNLIVITLKEWGSSDFTEEKMPHVYKMKKHGVHFSNHHNVAHSAQSGLFTLFYAVPASFETNLGSTGPFFLKELNHRNYEILDFGRNDEDSWVKFKSWSNNRNEVKKPFLLSLIMDGLIQESDALIQEMISLLQEKDLLENTHIVITGGHSGKNASLKIPFLYIDSERSKSEMSHPTSHYDILPTLTQNLWGCRNSFEVTGVGQSLMDSKREWLLSSSPDSFKIYDFIKNGEIEVMDGKIKTEGHARRELVFSAIKLLKKFN